LHDRTASRPTPISRARRSAPNRPVYPSDMRRSNSRKFG
jgi:hypothetical protein